MPWQEVSTMSLRLEFVRLAESGAVSVAELCARYGVSRKTGYKWLRRYALGGAEALADRSRRPHASPRRTPFELEAAVVAVRWAHPAWGGRKIARVLQNAGEGPVPAPSTVTTILHRHRLIEPAASEASKPWQRFEHRAPNGLWQMDFKGHFALRTGRCHPLTVLDDHSRYCVVLQACRDERRDSVQAALVAAFRRYGLPERMTMDNGAPWGHEGATGLTRLTVWLIRQGIRVGHSRPYHPQTQGKDERFHRTLNVELLRGRLFADLAECQRQFDRFRAMYNQHRPHESLALAVPASRYRPSPRPFVEHLVPIEYGPGDFVRKVQDGGRLSFQGRILRVSQALRGQPVALRPHGADGCFAVYFCHQLVAEIDLRSPCV